MTHLRGLLILALGGVQWTEAVHPGFISGPLNLSWVWIGFLVLMFLTFTTAKPPDQTGQTPAPNGRSTQLE